MPRAAPKKLLGKTEARLFTPPLRPLNRRTSLGYELADFAEMIGEPFLPWQRWFAIHALELLPDGSFRFKVILLLVARQNGKSSFGRTFTLWRMYVDGARNVLGVAQGLSLAREMWSISLSTIRRCPDLGAELEKTSNTNGDEWFRLTSGARYLIRAANREAGRGLSIDQLNIDEIREWRNWDAWGALSKTTMARPRAIILAMSNAGDMQSVVLNRLTDSGMSGRDPTIGIFEWSAEPGCALEDPQAWRQANPALGYTISEQAIRTAMTTDPPNVFRTEVLCQKVDHLDSAIDLSAWKSCADAAGTMDQLRSRITACVDVALDGAHVTLAVAAETPDGRIRTEIPAAWDGTDAARLELPALLDKIGAQVTAWYPSGPAAALAPLLRARPNSLELTGGKVTEACQGLADLTRDQLVVHPADPLLDAHIGGAQKLNSGDGWRFVRRGAGQHCDAAYACAGAIYAVQTMPPPAERARIRILG